jgi:hypothetical protein
LSLKVEYANAFVNICVLVKKVAYYPFLKYLNPLVKLSGFYLNIKVAGAMRTGFA